jgi:hypothetical protein
MTTKNEPGCGCRTDRACAVHAHQPTTTAPAPSGSGEKCHKVGCVNGPAYKPAGRLECARCDGNGLGACICVPAAPDDPDRPYRAPSLPSAETPVGTCQLEYRSAHRCGQWCAHAINIPAPVSEQGEGERCPISPCDGSSPVHRFATAEAYLTALLNDTERRVEGGKVYILDVDTIYHLRALVRRSTTPVESEGERLLSRLSNVSKIVDEFASRDGSGLGLASEILTTIRAAMEGSDAERS